MTVIRGKVHRYLGMTLDYTVSGQVQITMIDLLDKILIYFDKEEPKGAAKRQVRYRRISFRSTKIARSSHRIRLCSFKIWWQRLCMTPNEPGRKPAILLRF